MSTQHLKDMDLYEACCHILDAKPETLADGIVMKNDFIDYQAEHARQEILSMFRNSGIDSPREIRIFCNVEFYKAMHHDADKRGWRSRLIFDNESLEKLYGTFMIPCGEPSYKISWAFLASVYDENLEPYSTLCCNGFRTFKSGR